MSSPIADSITIQIFHILAHTLHPLDEFVSNLIAPTHHIVHLKRAIFRNGSVCAGLYVLAAILVNHVRRMLLPWLGQFIWLHSIENMKFAKSSPHYFVEASSYIDWREVWFWICQSLIGYFIRGEIGNRLVLMERESCRPREGPSKLNGSITNRFDAQKKTMGIFTILYLAMSLNLIESYYTQACFSAAYIYAISRLLRGGNDETAFLFDVLHRNWLGATFQAVLVPYWVCQRFMPCALQTIRAAATGRLALPVFHVVLWGGTAYLVRYSNKYFIFLELSDMFVTFGWMLLGIILVLGVKINGISRRDRIR